MDGFKNVQKMSRAEQITGTKELWFIENAPNSIKNRSDINNKHDLMGNDTLKRPVANNLTYGLDLGGLRHQNSGI